MVQKRNARRDRDESARSARPSPADLPCPCTHADGALCDETLRGEEDANELDANDPDENDPDDDQFDPNAVDFLGDFGLDDDEAIPDRNDFWFDDVDTSFD